MGILGITNRTENFKTAKTFAPFLPNSDRSGERRVRLVEKLLPKGTPTPTPDEIGIELFWKGVRDYIDDENRSRPKEEKRVPDDYTDVFVEAFERHFGELSAAVNNFVELNPRALNPLKAGNYSANGNMEDGTTSAKAKLTSNLNGIEIDIVLQTQNHLLIGEAKDESNFSTDSSQVLVHQLIGQYVQATILLDVLKIKKQVMPFIVCHDKAAVMKKGQVRFMIDQDWLKEENILTWDDIDAIAEGQGSLS